MKNVAQLTILCSLVGSLLAPTAYAAKEIREKNLVEKLPAKSVKRSYVDFSKDETAVVISPRASELDRLLKNSDRDLKSASRAASASASKPSVTTTVRSRKIMAAPEGDSAEPMTAMATPPGPVSTPAPTVVPKLTKVTASKPAEISVTATPAPVIVLAPAPAPAPLVIEKVEPVFVGPLPQPKPVAAPAPFETFAEFPESAKAPRTFVKSLPPIEPLPTVVEPPRIAKAAALTENRDESLDVPADRAESRLPRRVVGTGEGFLKSITPTSMVFIRAGYFNANYKKFDDRMKNGATSIGIAAARGLETSWGEFEARAAFDVYHAMDQSVSVDNIRMFTARTEVAYWLSHSRVKPGLSLGLGIVDYSIRSYRSISDTNENLVTLKTHAKSRAFTIIPATSLRIELAKELVIDAQTEFLALLGGESSDAAQGLGVNVSLGWMF